MDMVSNHVNVLELLKYSELTISKYSGGNGSKDKPYLISNKQDLKQLCNNSQHWSLHFKQTANIVFTTSDFSKQGDFYNEGLGFNPIGNLLTCFSGSYDGMGYEIDFLYINRPSSRFIGFFGITSDSSIVKNLGINDATVVGLDVVGVLVGENTGVVESCFCRGSVSGDDAVGVFIGTNNGIIDNCKSEGIVYGYCSVGGFVGINENEIKNSFSTTSVTAAQTVGGLVGWNNKGRVSNCYASGFVFGECFVGGLAGENYNGAIHNCFSTSEISGNRFFGGLLGYNENSNSENCYWNLKEVG